MNDTSKQCDKKPTSSLSIANVAQEILVEVRAKNACGATAIELRELATTLHILKDVASATAETTGSHGQDPVHGTSSVTAGYACSAPATAESAARDQINVLATQVGELITSFDGPVGSGMSGGAIFPDPRWLSIAKTDLQKGLMALRRAIEQPEGF